MKNPIKTYGFWLKIISAALLIAFSIWLLVDEKMAVFLVLMFTGLVAGIFALIRVIPLIRTLKSGKAKLTCFIEILLHLIITFLLIFGAISILNAEDKESGFANFMRDNYRFIIAFFFETRVISYFMCTVLYKEETDQTKFWIHILLLILGCVMCSLYNLDAHVIAIVIGVIALLCATGLIVEGGFGYGRYRKSIAKDRQAHDSESEEEKKEDEDELPTDDDIIIPVIDEQHDQDQIS